MLTGSLYFAGSIALALVIAVAWKPHTIGWWLVGFGMVFLTDAGVTIAIIWANNNVVPSYVSYWQLFTTVPVGVLLVALGLGIISHVPVCTAYHVAAIDPTALARPLVAGFFMRGRIGRHVRRSG